MKILIIGANGMLGQELGMVFKDLETVLWDKENLDITNEQDVMSKLASEHPEVVINAAAYNDVDGAENNEPLATAVNALAVRYLAKAVRAYNGILVHYSTDYVFKGDNKQGYVETDQPDPQSAYAQSKYQGEKNLITSGVQYYLIRLSRLFGRPAQGQNAKKSFVDTMIKLSETRSNLDVVDEEVSCPTYAPDLAGQTRYIIDQKLPFGIYHAANAGACTWYEFAKEIFAIKKIGVTLTPVPGSTFKRAAIRPLYSILRNTKLPALRSWQDALQEYLNESIPN
jgi:dTDP-4-dehydrorhamnose reductase